MTAMFPNVLDPAIAKGGHARRCAGRARRHDFQPGRHQRARALFARRPARPHRLRRSALVTPFELRAVQAGASHAPVELARLGTGDAIRDARSNAANTSDGRTARGGRAAAAHGSCPPDLIADDGRTGAAIAALRRRPAFTSPRGQGEEAPPAEPPQRKRSRSCPRSPDVGFLRDLGGSPGRFSLRNIARRRGEGTFDLVEGQPAKLREG